MMTISWTINFPKDLSFGKDDEVVVPYIRVTA
jgi:hypothetical protein